MRRRPPRSRSRASTRRRRRTWPSSGRDEARFETLGELNVEFKGCRVFFYLFFLILND